MTRSLAIPVTASALVWGGCGDGHIDANRADEDHPSIDCSMKAVALRIDPPVSGVDVGETRGSTVQFRALARFEDGSTTAAPARWSIEPAGLGSVGADGLFYPSGAFGGTATVTARAHGVENTALVDVKLVRELVTEADENLLDAFSRDRPRDSSSAAAPKMTSPSEGYRFPADPEQVTVDWEAGGFSGFRLLFVSATAEFAVLTRETAYQTTQEIWDWLARSNAGRDIRLVLEAVNRDGTVYRSSSKTVRMCTAVELCNSEDDNCNGQADEDCLSERQPFTGDREVAACD